MFEVQFGTIKRKVPVIFPSTLVHSEVAKALSKISGCSTRIVGAGELSIRTAGCHGKSTTLKIGSKKGDTEVINAYDYMFGLPDDGNIMGTVAEQLKKIFEEQDKGK